MALVVSREKCSLLPQLGTDVTQPWTGKLQVFQVQEFYKIFLGHRHGKFQTILCQTWGIEDPVLDINKRGSGRTDALGDHRPRVAKSDPEEIIQSGKTSTVQAVYWREPKANGQVADSSWSVGRSESRFDSRRSIRYQLLEVPKDVSLSLFKAKWPEIAKMFSYRLVDRKLWLLQEEVLVGETSKSVLSVGIRRQNENDLGGRCEEEIRSFAK